MERMSLGKRGKENHKEYNPKTNLILTIKTSTIGFEPMKQYAV